jgi:hypothetical protein
MDSQNKNKAISISNKLRWEAYSEEEKERRREIGRKNGKKVFEKYTLEDLQNFAKNAQEGSKLWWAKVSKDESLYQDFCNKVSSGKIEWWRNISEEKRKDIGLAVSNGVKNQWGNMSEEQKEIRNKKISDYWNSLSEEEKEYYSVLYSNIQKNIWDSLSEEEKNKRVFLISSGVKTETCHQRHQDSAHLYWDKAKEDGAKYDQHCHSIFTSNRWKHYQIGDKMLCFQSTWEYHLYLKLKEFNVNFRFTNEHHTTLNLGSCMWNPDFIVNEADIVEVKGHPFAYEKFYNRDFPAFMGSSYSKTHKLYLCEYSVDKKPIKTYEEFLTTCRLMNP